MNAIAFDTGSFRDPGGRVVAHEGRILRLIMPSAESQYRSAEDAGVMRRMVDAGRLVDYADVTEEARGWGLADASTVLSHEKVPFISYPYEWSYSQLRDAALFHLDFQLSLLENGFTLSDATAYNVQFVGPKPVFIDHLSVRPYVDGEIWAGHRQFCMQFLNPLLMWTELGIEPNHWFRGSLEGIPPEALAKMLPFKSKLSWTVLTNVVAQAAMQKRSVGAAKGSAEYRTAKLPKAAFVGMLQGLRRKIEKLKPPAHVTVWGDYAGRNSYGDPEAQAKAAFVRDMARSVQPDLLYDIGCNSGDYSKAAIEGGAKRVIGFDFDHGALELAFARAKAENLPFLPVWLDAANPSPSQGWGQAERKGLSGRAKPDALVALAFIHHIAIGRNVPLDMATDWLVDMAPNGIIEFPHKSDPMVQMLLSQREDIFPTYDNAHFAKLLGERARIVEAVDVLPTRTLYRYERT